MSTPPFIAMPDGVAVLAPPDAPAPVLIAEPRTSGAKAADVLLVPGFTGSKEDFLAMLEPLAELGWRVAAMDLPGQGGFPGLGPRGSNTLPALAAVVAEVLDWFAPDRRVHLVGHSMGGLVTRELVLAQPQRLASWTPICSGPGALPAGSHAPLVGLQAMLAVAPMEQIWAHKEVLDRAGGWDPPSAEVAEFCARRFIANDPIALADYSDILMSAPDQTEATAAALARTGLPVTVVTGALDDAWPPAWQQRMAARLGVPWREIPGRGHNPNTEDPHGTAALLDQILGSVGSPSADAVPAR